MNSFPLRLAIAFIFLLPAVLLGSVVSGTLKDESGALVPNARIQIVSAENPAAPPILVQSDGAGRYQTPDLKPGRYTISIALDGFEPLAKTIEVTAQPLTLDLQLAVAAVQTEVTVSAKAAGYFNSDPVYRQLRVESLGSTVAMKDFTLKNDAGTFHFKSGTLTFLAPVQGKVTGAIFIGDGHFTLEPATALERNNIRRYVQQNQVDEDFDEVVFRYTDGTGRALLQGVKEGDATAPKAAEALNRCNDKLRHRRQGALGFTEAVLKEEYIDNVEADILSSLYNPNHPTFANAYIHGRKHKDLRFFIRGLGAVPQLDAPEEVALINFDPEGMEDGIWYLAHRKSEYENQTANSLENKRAFNAKKFEIDTAIAGNTHLAATAKITFESAIEGERVVKFHLLPNLRVTRVTGNEAKDLFFIQESRKADGSFYAILPEPLHKGESRTIVVEYAGDKVVFKAGGGSYYVTARESWYPNINGFGERSLFDLTFRVPKHNMVISVGRLDKEWEEDKMVVSHWVTDLPVAVAGFNFGSYKKLAITDPKTNTAIEGYLLPELPDMLRPYQDTALSGSSPTGMTKFAMDQTRAQIEVCDYFFGKSYFNRIAITEQPDFNFGQSWPTLVYLPISAYLDATQRYRLFNRISSSLTAFVTEVTPHEVAHQWWGHTVGWASYHDQWLSEGFAEFSAGLYLQQTDKNWQKPYTEFWERLRKRVLNKNNFGIAPNDAGPIWMGLRLDSPHSPGAYNEVIYPKGAFILSMLRSMMYNAGDGDKAFIDMMHDFVDTHRGSPASTETLKAVAEKHLQKRMDFQGNGRLDWFFNEWVYGTEVPRYQLDYQLKPAEGGKTQVHMSLTQSDVGQDFAMLVPVFADFGKGWVRIGQLPAVGSSTRTFDMVLPAEPKKVMLNAQKDVLERL